MTVLLRRVLVTIALLGLLGGTTSCIIVPAKKTHRHRVHKADKHHHSHCHRRGKRGKKRVCHNHGHRQGHH